jgi:hypothetical protein
MAEEEDVLGHFRATSRNLPVTSREYHKTLLTTAVHQRRLHMITSVNTRQTCCCSAKDFCYFKKVIRILDVNN